MTSARQRAGRALLWLSFWVALGLFFASRELILDLVSFDEPIVPTETLLSKVASFLVWGFFSLPIERLRRRFPLDGVRRRNLYLHALVSIVGVALHLFATDTLAGLAERTLALDLHTSGGFWFDLGVSFHWDLAIYWILMLVLEARAQDGAATEAESRARELRLRLNRARLDSLRAQLHPHFLFNTLNSISELLDLEPAAADRMIERFANLIRRNADTRDLPTTSLRDELDFVRQYLEVEATRFGARLTHTMVVEPALLDAQVPTLLLQPLVENAVRHGVARLEAGGVVALRVSSTPAGLSIELVNDCPRPATEAASGAGVGLANSRARLKAQFGAAASLIAGRQGDGTRFSVEVSIPSAAIDTNCALDAAFGVREPLSAESGTGT